MCQRVRLPGGGVAIVCGGRRSHGKNAPCAFCDATHTRLCDWPLGEGHTCDLKLCERHATHVGPGLDYCPDHAMREELSLPAEKRAA